MSERIELDVAKRYVQCIRGETGLSPLANDELRRTIHDTIAHRLGCDASLVKRAAHIVEHFSFSDSAFLSKYDDTDVLAKFFKKHLDDIADANERGLCNATGLIANWTFDTLHPEWIGGAE